MVPEIIIKKLTEKLEKDFDFLSYPEIKEDMIYEEMENLKFNLKCKHCGNTLLTSYRSVFRDRKNINTICKECKRRDRLKLEYEKLKIREKERYEILTDVTEYTSFQDMITVKCLKCGLVSNIRPSNHTECICNKNHINAINDIVFSNFKEKYSDFELLEYKNIDRVGKIKHKSCGEIFYKNFSAFHRFPKCPKCIEKENYKKSLENYSEKLLEHAPEFELLTFNGWKTSLKLRHKTCGYTFERHAMNVLRRELICPICDKKNSVGASIIKKYLKKKGVTFSEEYSFQDLKDKKRLRFDFAIFNCDNSIFALIEFDGIQHFSTEKGFFGQSLEVTNHDLEYIQNHDKMKDDYCEKNNINLLRIRYDENIKEKLELLFNDYPNGGEIPQ